MKARIGKHLVLGILGFAALSGCAAVMETSLDTTPLPIEAGRTFGQVTIVIVTANLEKNSDLIDPAKLKTAVEDQLNAAGVFSESRVFLSPVSDAQGLPRADVAIVLTRMDFTIQSLRLPPTPPPCLGCLYPLVAPVLLKRDYLKLQAAVEADLFFSGADGRVAKQLFLSETADARANFFNSGGERAAAKLTAIALHNFSRRVLAEFLYLTR